MGEEERPVLIHEDWLAEVEEGVKADEDVGEEKGRVCTETPLPSEEALEKQKRDLETEFKEVCSADTGVGEDAGTILNGEEQGDSWTEE